MLAASFRPLGRVGSVNTMLTELEPMVWAKPRAKPEPAISERPVHRVHLPGFLNDEEIGLGDIIENQTYAIGIQPCGGC